ncbi:MULTISPECIES: hypothetical protein [Nocardia]|uniref:Acid stress chaperone HdeA n=1 Tax=Nocardia iowensis TaxID=204891 RepID=A0ABX8RHV5_NOCIO|nr:hypothetical protein [Nocardia iowensis]QXN88931.1 hypothetical protein KV110_25540 [Nocardia iowensis]
MTKTSKLLVFASAAALLLVGGCGDEPEKLVNKGGDTPCSEFSAQDPDKQRITVTKFLEQERGGDAPPTQDRTVDAAIASIKLMCAAQANPDTPIKKADLTGILVPK